jgi:hypothetical protein
MLIKLTYLIFSFVFKTSIVKYFHRRNPQTHAASR